MQLCELIISVCLSADQYSYLHLYTHHSHTIPIDTVATSGPNTSTNVAYGANKEVLTTSNPEYVVQRYGVWSMGYGVCCAGYGVPDNYDG